MTKSNIGFATIIGAGASLALCLAYALIVKQSGWSGWTLGTVAMFWALVAIPSCISIPLTLTGLLTLADRWHAPLTVILPLGTGLVALVLASMFLRDMSFVAGCAVAGHVIAGAALAILSVERARQLLPGEIDDQLAVFIIATSMSLASLYWLWQQT